MNSRLDISRADAARIRHDWSDRVRATVQGAVRYSRFVALMKRALPAAAFAIIVAVLGFFFVARQPSKLSMTYKSLGHVENDLAMTKPRLSGTDGQGNPFVITAEVAIQDARNAKRARLKKIEADFSVGKDDWLSARAAQGVVDMTAGTLALDGGLQIFSDRGYQLQSARAAVDINKGIVLGPQEVTGQGPLGTLRADGFRFDRTSGQLLLDGHVEMSLIRTAK